MERTEYELEALANGDIPDSLNFSLENIIQSWFEEHMIYKTFTPEFVINYFDHTILYMFPELRELAEKEYEENKHRTPLQEMTERQELAKSKLEEQEQMKKSQSILYDN